MKYEIGDRYEYLGGDMPYMDRYDFEGKEFVITNITTNGIEMYNGFFDNVSILCSELELDKYFKPIFDEPAPIKPQAIVLPKENRVMDKVQKHKELCEHINAVYAQKNAAYGDSFGETYKKLGIISAVTRISDKYNRLVNLATHPEVDKGDESIVDTLIDMSNYCLMTVMELVEFPAEEEIACEGTTLD